MDTLFILIAILIVSYVLFYISVHNTIEQHFENYKETKLSSKDEHRSGYNASVPLDDKSKIMQEGVNKQISEEGVKPVGAYTVLDTSLSQAKPYVTTEDQAGDFELDVIEQKEGGYNPTRDAVNAARRKLPFEWSQMPPSASRFQEQQAVFVKDNANTAAPYVSLQDKNSQQVLPPDEAERQAAENSILQAYQPKTTEDLQTVDAKSVSDLMMNLYSKKGLIPQVIQKSNNVFEIISLQEKNPKIIYEDEVQSSIQSNELNPILDPAEMLVSPQAVTDLTATFSKPTDTNEHLSGRQFDVSNPNLETIFGKKMSWQQWG